MTTPEIRRSLSSHGPARRRPHDLVRRWAETIEPDTPPDEPARRLEERFTELLGTESALFFPTGTMAQQAVLRVHAERRGRGAFAGHPYLHLDNWEERGYAVVHGLRFHPAGDHHRLLTTADLAAVTAPLAAVVWELPQRDIGGSLPDWDDLREQIAHARSRGAAAHLDGARIFEAQPFYDRPYAEIAGLFDTVYVSLYKGLRGVSGAVLAGDAQTIGEAATWRLRLGGAVPDVWPQAVAALRGLDEQVPRMPEFRDRAVELAAALHADGIVRVVPDPPQTPLFHVHVPVAPADLERAGREMIERTGVQMFLRVRTASDPDRCSFEVTVGENAMELPVTEVVELVRDLVGRARRSA